MQKTGEGCELTHLLHSVWKERWNPECPGLEYLFSFLLETHPLTGDGSKVPRKTARSVSEGRTLRGCDVVLDVQ